MEMRQFWKNSKGFARGWGGFLAISKLMYFAKVQWKHFFSRRTSYVINGCCCRWKRQQAVVRRWWRDMGFNDFSQEQSYLHVIVIVFV